jgi:hypothetical protein
VEDPQYLHLIVHLVNSDERERNKDEFSGVLDATSASQVRKGFKCRDTLDKGLRNPPCGIGTASAM